MKVYIFDVTYKIEKLTRNCFIMLKGNRKKKDYTYGSF